MEISLLSTEYLFRKATAASVITTNFSRMTLIASGSILSGGYGPSDSTQTKRNLGVNNDHHQRKWMITQKERHT